MALRISIMRFGLTFFGSLCVVAGLLSTQAVADDWATLKGRLVYDGKPPVRAKCNVNRDQAVCTKNHPLEEGIVVDGKGGLANVLVWVRTKKVKVHPDYEASAKDTVVMDNLNCRYAPHVVAVRAGQTLRVSNSDTAGHNTLGRCRTNPEFNENIPPGSHKDIVLKKAERRPFEISCAIHGWMKGYVLVKDHPYMAVTAADGTFEIANLPAGEELEFQFWQAKAGYVQDVTVDGKATKWKRGRVTKTLSEGETDLGDILVDPKAFK